MQYVIVRIYEDDRAFHSDVPNMTLTGPFDADYKAIAYMDRLPDEEDLVESVVAPLNEPTD